MVIATWNVNSIRVRLDRVLNWLAARQPDVVCLQETKVEDKDFPFMAFKIAGYNAVHCGQKTYNGVAILSKQPLTDVQCGIGDGHEDAQARLIAATVQGVRVISVYVPNGEALDSPKFAYKLQWLSRLRAFLDQRYEATQPIAMCGDYNIAPEARDVYDPPGWENSTLFHQQVRTALGELEKFGLTDAYRICHQEEGRYSWWDYRMLGFPKNKGLRIDHLLVSEPLARRCVASEIDREARKGEQPSDHAPVLATFEWDALPQRGEE
jgi:exodeoxyribonuclease-3